MEIREATAEHAGFLPETLVEACNWTGEQRVAPSDVEVHPRLRHYVRDWPRAQDFGMIAIGDDGASVGAAWARTFSAPRGTASWLRTSPELSMAVGSWRDIRRAILRVCRQNGLD